MPVPDFQSFFKPLLDVAVDGKEHSMKEAREIIAKRMNIAEQDLRVMLRSGTQTKFDNRHCRLFMCLKLACFLNRHEI